MNPAAYQLAQINIARMLAPLDSPTMSGFVARLDEINALADGSPGFVWRLQTPEGDATSLRPWEDDMIIVNMSVWETREALFSYVYRGAHLDVLRQRKQWFEHLGGAFVALWWIRSGHIPSVEEAKHRLEHLEAHGPTPYAFTFRQFFPAPDTVKDHPLQVTPAPVDQNG